MNSTRFLQALLLLLCAFWTTPGTAGDDPRLGKFSAFLQRAGFTVQTGATVKAIPFQWFDNLAMDSLAGNNAGQYYKVLQVPLLPGENNTDVEKSLALFMIREDEAVVWVGPTPPACDYFSFTPFLWVRHKNPLIPKGDWLFASTGDPLNNFWIQTETGAQFAANTMVIFTADQGIYQKISSMAQLSGYGANMINLYVIPSSVLNLGISPQSDSFSIIVRTANFLDQNAGNAYLNNNNYATVFRITPNYNVNPQPYAWPNPRNREVGPEGGANNPALQAGLERLKAAILAKTPHARSQSYDQSSIWFYNSRDVLPDNSASPAYRKFVAGESSDTPYLRTSRNGVDPENFTLGKNEMVVVYGVNHTATGFATYSSFGIYGEWQTNVNSVPFYFIGANDLIWNGVSGMTNHDFTGSAAYYLPGDPMAPYLYAARVVRGPVPPGDKYCVSVPEPTEAWWVTPNVPGTGDGIGLNQPLMVGYRAYVNPVSKAGPAYSDIIPDRAIWFRKPSVQGPLDLLLLTD